MSVEHDPERVSITRLSGQDISQRVNLQLGYVRANGLRDQFSDFAFIARRTEGIRQLFQ
jgi:hypothetical protein